MISAAERIIEDEHERWPSAGSRLGLSKSQGLGRAARGSCRERARPRPARRRRPTSVDIASALARRQARPVSPLAGPRCGSPAPAICAIARALPSMVSLMPRSRNRLIPASATEVAHHPAVKGAAPQARSRRSRAKPLIIERDALRVGLEVVPATGQADPRPGPGTGIAGSTRAAAFPRRAASCSECPPSPGNKRLVAERRAVDLAAIPVLSRYGVIRQGGTASPRRGSCTGRCPRGRRRRSRRA